MYTDKNPYHLNKGYGMKVGPFSVYVSIFFNFVQAGVEMHFSFQSLYQVARCQDMPGHALTNR